MAEAVRLEKVGSVYVLTLRGEGEHRFNEPLLEAIVEALETVQNAEDARALVTTNEGKFFSNGLDMNWVRRQREAAEAVRAEEKKEIVIGTSRNSEREGGGKSLKNGFNELLATVVNMNVPTIAAICGHASAGGFIFALAHDHRCMRGDRGYMYMSEMDVQVRITSSTMKVIKTTLSPKAFKDTVLLARRQTAREALQAGIVDSVHENAAETREAAIAWAKQLSDRGWDRTVYRTMRLDMNPGLLEELIDGIYSPKSYPLHPTLSKL